MSAKVDSAALQDGYDLYHHCFFFTPTGARPSLDFVCEPHNAVTDLTEPRPARSAPAPGGSCC